MEDNEAGCIDRDRDDEYNVEDVVGVVEAKDGLVVLCTEGRGNLSSNDDVYTGTGGVQDTHHHRETEAGPRGVSCSELIVVFQKKGKKLFTELRE